MTLHDQYGYYEPDGGSGLTPEQHDELDHAGVTGVPSIAGLATEAYVDDAIGDIPPPVSAADDVTYSNAYIEDAGGSAAEVKAALDFILQKLRDNSLIASLVLLWDGTTETDLVTPQGQTFTNVTYSATGGPTGGAKFTAATHANPVLSLSGFATGTRLRCTVMKRSDSGGGTVWSFNVQSGGTTIDASSGTWAEANVTVTVGANGLFSVSAGWNPQCAYMLIENLGIA